MRFSRRKFEDPNYDTHEEKAIGRLPIEEVNTFLPGKGTYSGLCAHCKALEHEHRLSGGKRICFTGSK